MQVKNLLPVQVGLDMDGKPYIVPPGTTGDVVTDFTDDPVRSKFPYMQTNQQFVVVRYADHGDVQLAWTDVEKVA